MISRKSSVLAILCLVPVMALAQPPEATTVMDNMVDAKLIPRVDYSFLAVAYDTDEDVLYYAARDGEHFDPTMEVVYRLPIAAINHVNVMSNTDIAIKDGKRINLETGFDDSATADFERLKRGCSVRLVAKEHAFGFAGLAEGIVSDGQFTVEYAELEVDPAEEVDIGFYDCPHARKLQMEFQKLHKQVMKGN